MKVWVGVAFVLCANAFSMRAVAEAPPEPDTARALFAAGVEHADAGRDAEALIAFKRAYDRKPHFAVLYNIAQLELRLGDEQAALETLRRYLTTGGDEVPPARRRWAKSIIEDLTRSPDLETESETAPGLVTQPTPERAKLNVSCPWFDFTVSVDSKPMAQTPFTGSLLLPAGAHEVTFFRQGYESRAFPVNLSHGKPATVECRPKPIEPVPPALRARICYVARPMARIRRSRCDVADTGRAAV